MPFAIGSETWGSIQFPAAFCGVTGLRPTYGRVSRHGAMALSWTMDKLGPLARTAEDCGLVLAAVAGRTGPIHPALPDRFEYPLRERRRRYRLGVLRGSSDKTQPEVRRNFEDALAVLRQFCDVQDDLELPAYPYEAMASIVIDAECGSAFEPLFQSGRITELTAPEDRVGGYSGQVLLAKDYLRALRLRRRAAAALDELLGTVDAIAAPTLPTVAWPIDAPFDKVYPDYPGGASIGGPANLAGVPGLFLPNGTGEAGLPPASSSPDEPCRSTRCSRSAPATSPSPSITAAVPRDCDPRPTGVYLGSPAGKHFRPGAGVNVLALPPSPEALAKARWEDIAPYFDELAELPLDRGTMEAWLRSWSALEELVTEAAAQAMIAYSIDTSDPDKEADHLRFSTEVMPRMEERSVELARRLVESGYSPPELATTLARFRTSIEIFREANVPLFAELEELSARYQRITGSMTVMWEGQERPLPQLQPFLKSADRSVRERAFRASTGPYLEQRGDLAALFDRMYALRQQVARNAGFANFRDYVFPAKFRFDYTPADCERFHEAVERTAAPAVERMLAVRRGRLGLDALRPWDLAVDPYRSGPAPPVHYGGRVRRPGPATCSPGWTRHWVTSSRP